MTIEMSGGERENILSPCKETALLSTLSQTKADFNDLKINVHYFKNLFYFLIKSLVVGTQKNSH